MRPAHIYKILQIFEWETLSISGSFAGSPVDLKDGYIHLSTAGQLQGTLDKHYTEGRDVVIVQVLAYDIADDIKYEVSRGGAEFPHLYALLKLDSVSQHWVLSPDRQGRYAVSDILL